MKLIQVNARHFKRFDELLGFLEAEQADVVTMQEVGVGEFCDDSIQRDNLAIFQERLGYGCVVGKNCIMEDEQGQSSRRGNAIFSKWPIIDYHIHYVPLLGTATRKTKKDLFLDRDLTDMEVRQKARMACQELPSTFVECLIRMEDTYIRVLTSHFPASPKCTETYLIIKHAEHLVHVLGNVSSHPTIFAADCNIMKSSGAIKLIEAYLTSAAQTDDTTLNPRIHIGFKNDIPPAGYQVDHILYKGCTLQSREIYNTDVSDHLPVKAEFSF